MLFHFISRESLPGTVLIISINVNVKNINIKTEKIKIN